MLNSNSAIGLIFGFVSLAALPVVAQTTNADKDQASATAKMAAEAHMQVGMPGITNFTERKLARFLYELRDQEGLATYTYIIDWEGNRHFFCDSVGYGLPYAVQFSNPERVAHEKTYEGGSFGTLPQPEPNGLFMPDALSATWVICADPENGGSPRTVYVEPEILVSPFPLHQVAEVSDE